MKNIRLCLTVILTASIAVQSFAAVRSAVNSGKWEHPSTWSGGVVPACGDSVVVGPGKVVEISKTQDFSSCSKPMKLNITGELLFDSDKQLSLPCNSFISLNTGGRIYADKGKPGTSHIAICKTNMWDAGMGALNGAMVIERNPIPLELVHFSARTEGESVVLSWLTTSELNNDYFMIEKSKDGIDFKDLGMMDAAGTATNINSYKMIDIIPFDGVQYYRLRLVDFDGRSASSKSVAVKWTRGVECNIYPNPTKGELFANIDPRYSGQTGQLLVNNSEGKLLLTKEVRLEESGYGVKLLQSREFLKPGSYLVTLNFKEKTFTQYVVSR